MELDRVYKCNRRPHDPLQGSWGSQCPPRAPHCVSGLAPMMPADAVTRSLSSRYATSAYRRDQRDEALRSVLVWPFESRLIAELCLPLAAIIREEPSRLPIQLRPKKGFNRLPKQLPWKWSCLHPPLDHHDCSQSHGATRAEGSVQDLPVSYRYLMVF